MLVSKKKKKDSAGTRRSSAVSESAQREVESVRKYLMDAVPEAQLDEDFLVKVASTYGLSRKNPSVLAAAVKKLQKQ